MYELHIKKVVCFFIKKTNLLFGFTRSKNGVNVYTGIYDLNQTRLNTHAEPGS